jgi:hypothetical protein
LFSEGLDKNTLHGLLSSRSLGIENEDALLQLLIEFGSDYFEFWSYIEVTFLSEEGFSLFIDKLQFSGLTPEVWYHIVSRVKSDADSEVCMSCLFQLNGNHKHLDQQFFVNFQLF